MSIRTVETYWDKHMVKLPGLLADGERIVNHKVTEQEVRAVSISALRQLRRKAIDCSFETRQAWEEFRRNLPPPRLIRNRKGDEITTRSRGKDRLHLQYLRLRLSLLHHNRKLINKVLMEDRARTRAIREAKRATRIEKSTELLRKRGKANTELRRKKLLLGVAQQRSLKDKYQYAMIAAQRERSYKNKDPELYAQLMSIIAALRPRVKNARAGSATSGGNLVAP
jgi:hypothetical protein